MSEKTDRPPLSLVASDDAGSGEVGEFPRTFGNYLLLSPLGQGGMGDVYLGKIGGIAGIEKHCVLKTLRPQFTDDREYVSRFIDEARVVVTLSHKNICSVFDVGHVESRYYLAMEYIAGRDLKTLVANTLSIGEKLDLGIVLYIVSEVLEALDYAHRHIDHTTGEPMRIVHRDVSPANVMVSFEGEVKLIDFGLAASTLKLERTEPNVVMGKVAYMSPEQVRGEAVDGRTDVFAVGVMLYELLTNERYYEGKTPYEIWSLAGSGSFKPRRWQAIDPELRSILTLALAPNRDERFKTAADMRESIEVFRVHHALRGSTLALRELVERAMPQEISESRLKLAKFKNVKLLRTTSPPSGATPSSPPTGSSPTGSLIGPNDDTIRAPRDPAPSRAPLFVAGGVAVAAIIALVVVIIALWPRTTSTTATPPIAATPPVAVAPVADTPVAVAPVDAAPVDAAPVAVAPVVVAPVAVAPVVVAPVADAPVAPVPPVVDAAPTAKATAQAKAPQARAPLAKAPQAKAPQAKAPQAKAPAEAKKTGNAMLDDVIARCPALACTLPLEQMAPQVSSHFSDRAWMTTWKDKLAACRAQCPR